MSDPSNRTDSTTTGDLFVRLPHSVARDPRLTPTDKAVLSGIASHLPRAEPSIASLMEYVGRKRTTVEDSVRRLERLGYLLRHFQPGRRTRYTVSYQAASPPADRGGVPRLTGAEEEPKKKNTLRVQDHQEDSPVEARGAGDQNARKLTGDSGGRADAGRSRAREDARGEPHRDHPSSVVRSEPTDQEAEMAARKPMRQKRAEIMDADAVNGPASWEILNEHRAAFPGHAVQDARDVRWMIFIMLAERHYSPSQVRRALSTVGSLKILDFDLERKCSTVARADTEARQRAEEYDLPEKPRRDRITPFSHPRLWEMDDDELLVRGYVKIEGPYDTDDY